MNDWRRENSQPSSSSRHFPPWELYTSIIIFPTFPTMRTTLLAQPSSSSLHFPPWDSSSSHFPPWEYSYWLEPSPSPSWEKSATHICQHGIEVWEQLCLVTATSHHYLHSNIKHKTVFLSRKKDVWGCGYDLTYEDLSKTLINGLSNCGLSPAWSDRHKVDKLGNHGGQKKSIFSSVGSSNLKLPSKILAPELSTKWSKLVEVVLSHSNLDEISFLALSNLAFPFQVFLSRKVETESSNEFELFYLTLQVFWYYIGYFHLLWTMCPLPVHAVMIVSPGCLSMELQGRSHPAACLRAPSIHGKVNSGSEDPSLGAHLAFLATCFLALVGILLKEDSLLHPPSLKTF